MWFPLKKNYFAKKEGHELSIRGIAALKKNTPIRITVDNETGAVDFSFLHQSQDSSVALWAGLERLTINNLCLPSACIKDGKRQTFCAIKRQFFYIVGSDKKFCPSCGKRLRQLLKEFPAEEVSKNPDSYFIYSS